MLSVIRTVKNSVYTQFSSFLGRQFAYYYCFIWSSFSSVS